MLRLVILLLTIMQYASAAWATRHDAAWATTNAHVNIHVHADGSHDFEATIDAVILNEAGRAAWSQYTRIYNSNQSRFKLKQAYTEVQGKRYDVSPQHIEDKTLASYGKSFDELHQVLIAFPKLAIGAKVHLSFHVTQFKPYLKGFYTHSFLFGTNSYLEHEDISLKSEIPLYLANNDPDHFLHIETDEKEAFHKLHITLNKPVYRQTVNEPGVINPKHQVMVAISSMASWPKLAHRFAPLFTETIKQPLPAMYEAIKDNASQAKTDHDIINRVTSQLARKIEYLSDARTSMSSIKPHDLATTVELGLGDCKDFSVATGAILKRLGFTVTPALVLRGEASLQPPTNLPTPEHFNHVIIHASRHNQNYWIDPTNLISMVDGIYPDIAGKQVILLDKNTDQIINHLPQIDPLHNRVDRQETWQLSNDLLKIKGQLGLYGEAVLSVLSDAQFLSQQALSRNLLYILNNKYLPHNSALHLPKDLGRIAHDLSFNYELLAPPKVIQSNLGGGFILPDSQISELISQGPEIVSDLYLGAPRSFQHTYLIKNAKADNLEKLNTSLSTPWFKIKRTFQQQERGILIHEYVVYKVNFLKNEDYHSKIFNDFKYAFMNKMQHQALMFNKGSLTS